MYPLSYYVQQKPKSWKPDSLNPYKGNVKGIPALFGLNPVSNSIGFTVVSFCRSHCSLLPESKHRNAEHFYKNHVGCVKASSPHPGPGHPNMGSSLNSAAL